MKAVASDVLHVAYYDDMGTPDPDSFYGTEGLMVTDSVYDGLLRYAPNSTKIVPQLASLPTISTDGRTYTFQLHAGAKFHDGTAVDSTAVKASFARRNVLKQGPAYMLAEVSSVDTLGRLTVVVHLKRPVSAFLDYLASAWGPKITNPTELAAHEVSGDHGQKWLQTHDAGSGPYEISSFVPNQKYILTRFVQYWGPAAHFNEADFTIQPSVTSQQLELQKGQLDVILHGLSSQTLSSLANTKGLTEHAFPTLLKTLVFVNPNKGAFTSQAARVALAQALDKATLTKEVFGNTATASTQIYPAGEIPLSATTSTVKYDSSILKSIVGSLPTKAVDIGYDSTDPRNQQMAEFVQLALQNVGLTATTRAIPISDIYALPQHAGQAPTLLVQTTPGDAAHPDTWARIYMSAGGGANYFQCKDPAVDAALNQGLDATTPAAVNAAYGNAGNLINKNGCFIDLSDVQDVVVTRSNLTGVEHIPAIPSNISLDTIANG